MRQIAERAGVTAMMLNRCFGSKARLFAQAVERASAPPTVVRDRLPGLADSVARTLAERTAPAPNSSTRSCCCCGQRRTRKRWTSSGRASRPMWEPGSPVCSTVPTRRCGHNWDWR
ncbi:MULTISPECIES: TetR/AcrR family transcriptional regulator [unclassified Streptomyces]|uniref:TetR/AcrR family transcriptional regulator n=1 Tax=unclassified Streptomyces TaxID=2593676 RepID=UPI002475732E|nr:MULTISPECIES: TetR/AcrR family transcriptional regulator [unclassified Streptomyces]